MNATYTDEYDEEHDCIFIGPAWDDYVKIELDGEVGYCPASRVEIDE